MTALLGDTARDLIDRFEQRFTCIQGEPKAFFELPQTDGSVVRGIYVAYALRGTDLGDLKQFFIEQVLDPLVERSQAANESKVEAAGPFLYWRLSGKIHLEFFDGVYAIRTRICVLDNELNEVRIDDMIKHEGELIPICAYEAGVRI